MAAAAFARSSPSIPLRPFVKTPAHVARGWLILAYFAGDARERSLRQSNHVRLAQALTSEGACVDKIKALVRQVPWRWALYWLLVPNFLIILMWPIGGPPMQPAPLVFGLVALLVSMLPWVGAKRL